MQDIRGDFLERWFIREERGACWTVGCYRGGMSERGQFDSGLIIEGALL